MIRPGSESNGVVLADRHVNFLAGLCDPLAEALMLALKLAGIHRQNLTEECTVTGVGLMHKLFERVFDLIGQIQ